MASNTNDPRATYENGNMDTYDGRTVYTHTATGAQWITVSNGVANTHNTDYPREVQESVEVYITHGEGDDRWVEATCTYNHIIPMEMYVADNPEPQPHPVVEEGYRNVWGNREGHTPQWVIDYGCN